MILTLALFAAAPVEAAPDLPPQQEIVVLSKKLDAVRFRWNATEDHGVRTLASCEIVRSSGDKDVDTITCRATEACLPVLDKVRRQRKPLFDTCLTQTRRRMITELFDARALAMAEAGPSQ